MCMWRYWFITYCLLFPQHWLDIARRFRIAFSRHCRIREGIIYGFPTARTRISWRYSILWSYRGSFVHLLAYHGFDEFVLSEIAIDEQLKHTTGNLSLLISVIQGGEDRLAFALLDAGIVLDDFVFPTKESAPPTMDQRASRSPIGAEGAELVHCRCLLEESVEEEPAGRPRRQGRGQAAPPPPSRNDASARRCSGVEPLRIVDDNPRKRREVVTTVGGLVGMGRTATSSSSAASACSTTGGPPVTANWLLRPRRQRQPSLDVPP